MAADGENRKRGWEVTDGTCQQVKSSQVDLTCQHIVPIGTNPKGKVNPKFQ